MIVTASPSFVLAAIVFVALALVQQAKIGTVLTKEQRKLLEEHRPQMLNKKGRQKICLP